MATYVLIHGASFDSWYWHLVAPELQARGHAVVAPDLPCDDDAAGLSEFADVVVRAIGDRSDLVVVAHSLAGFTAPLVCDRVPARLLVLVAAMVPLPGESVDDWWVHTGWAQARLEQAERDGHSLGDTLDIETDFYHDVPPDVRAEAFARGERPQAETPFRQPWPLTAWPSVPTRFLLCRHDRFFPATFMRRIVTERLGMVPGDYSGEGRVEWQASDDGLQRGQQGHPLFLEGS